jgi:hypothetical protein
LFDRRVTVFVGHFGSGKTEIALNGALDLARRGEEVTLADLDVVKPYFRSRSARNILAEAGVKLLAPEGENIHGDLPIIVPQIRSVLRDETRRVIMDVGGDGSGARVLGSLIDVIPVDETDCYVVLNFSRPSTPDVDGAVAMVEEIEMVSRVKVTGLVSNTHLMSETTAEVVLDGHHKAVETGRRLGIPLVAVAAQEGVAAGAAETIDCPLIRLRRIVVPPHEQTIQQRTTGPLFVVN